jgi:hypothetical protein
MQNAIVAYKNGSASAKALSAALGLKLLKHEGKEKKLGTLINWGLSKRPERIIWAENLLNHPDSVALATNKLLAFENMDGWCTIPEFTKRKEEALEWLAEGVSVVARQKLNGHSGQGIVLMDKIADIVDAPLYTKYIKKNNEYRVHVFQGVPFFIQRKARDFDVPVEQVNWQIRNHANGFIFAHVGVQEMLEDLGQLEALQVEACNAVLALGLDFGAVDVLQRGNAHNHDFVVLEVNTAPGLEGTTLEKYVERFKEVLE